MKRKRRVFALQSWSAEKRADGWYVARTNTTFSRQKRRWRGPYSSTVSVSLMIARELKRELAQRDARFQ